MCQSLQNQRNSKNPKKNFPPKKRVIKDQSNCSYFFFGTLLSLVGKVMVNLTLLFEWSAFSVLRGLVRIVVLWMEVPLVVPFVFANRLFLTVTFDTVNPSSDEVEEEEEEPLSLEVELRSFRWKSASSINSILCGVGGDCGGVVPRLWGDRVMTPTGANLGLFGSNVKSGIFFSAVEISVDFFGLAGWEILAATKSFSRGIRIWNKVGTDITLRIPRFFLF